MKRRFTEMLDELADEDLMNMYKDIAEGSVELKFFVAHKLKERDLLKKKFCSICQSELEPTNTNNYTLTFGPRDFLKRAQFCGIDCCEYFIDQLKELKAKKR